MAGLNLTNHESMIWAEIKSQMLNWLNHPGASMCSVSYRIFADFFFRLKVFPVYPSLLRIFSINWSWNCQMIFSSYWPYDFSPLFCKCIELHYFQMLNQPYIPEIDLIFCHVLAFSCIPGFKQLFQRRVSREKLASTAFFTANYFNSTYIF